MSTTAAVHAPHTSAATEAFWRAVTDLALAAVTGALTLALLSHFASAQAPEPRQVLAAIAVAAPILLWRRWPLVTFGAATGFAIGFAVVGEAASLPVGPALALYLLAASRDEHGPWPRASMATVGGLLVTYLAVVGSSGRPSAGELVHATLAFAAAWFAGERTRLHHAHLAELRARADRVERDAARERDLAVAEERNRIARDLHDSAAHALNVIAVRAGAARLRHDPERDLAALTDIEDLARQTMNDIDQFVGTLRCRGGDFVEVPPGLAALETLVGQHIASGHQVNLTRVGEPQLLAAPTDHGAYRIVQEALTNAARYGDGTTRVRVAYAVEGLDVTITNVMRPASSRRSGGGHGLIGMCERATSLDGSLSAQPVGVEFVVHARLPYQGRRS